VEDADGYLSVIDAIAVEDLSYSGSGDVDWESGRSGDIETERGMCEWCRDDLARVLGIYRDTGLPVFTVDYCVEPENADEAIRYSRSHGFVPFVSRTPLDRLPDGM
jgi:endo-alpha-1,4-polygalactosaminidase (GH114 family)